MTRASSSRAKFGGTLRKGGGFSPAEKRAPTFSITITEVSHWFYQ
jgi:hypothetical protein